MLAGRPTGISHHYGQNLPVCAAAGDPLRLSATLCSCLQVSIFFCLYARSVVMRLDGAHKTLMSITWNRACHRLLFVAGRCAGCALESPSDTRIIDQASSATSKQTTRILILRARTVAGAYPCPIGWSPCGSEIVDRFASQGGEPCSKVSFRLLQQAGRAHSFWALSLEIC